MNGGDELQSKLLRLSRLIERMEAAAQHKDDVTGALLSLLVAHRIPISSADLIQATKAVREQRERLQSFAYRFLSPEEFGFAVSAEIRDAAREALGHPKVETK